MKRIFTLFTVVMISAVIIAQTPNKMSYQAVIRDSGGNLVTEQQVGIKISILQGTADGMEVYTETMTPTTNKNGLVSVEIGSVGGFADIDWADGPYFLKTETDPSGGANYTISGTSQLLTVPYALHAKTAETISKPIVESDPLFVASPAAGIGAAGIGNWDEAHSWGDHAVEGYLTQESEPLFAAWDKSAGIEITESQISDLQTYYLASNPDGFITAYIVTEEDVTAHESALSITESQITDLQTYLTSITGQSVGDLADINLTGIEAGKVLKYDAVAQEWVVADDLGLTEETDPAVAANFDFTDAANGDLLQFNGTKWVKVTPDYISDYTVSETDVTTHQGALTLTESQISDLGNYIETETDPSVPAGTQAGEMQYWNGTEWRTIQPGAAGQILVFINGMPTWGIMGMSDNDVHNPSTGKVWIDRNLGASRAATSSADALAYGDLYQWGRAADGHQIRTSGTITTLSNSDTPGHGDFILAPDSPYDWFSPQYSSLWQGVSGTNNPCPTGYRLPTDAEWDSERLSWSSNDAAGAFGSPLKLPVAGSRYTSNGSLSLVGSRGYYWSSTVYGTYSRYLNFSSSDALMYSYFRACGYSVRCLKD